MSVSREEVSLFQLVLLRAVSCRKAAAKWRIFWSIFVTAENGYIRKELPIAAKSCNSISQDRANWGWNLPDSPPWRNLQKYKIPLRSRAPGTTSALPTPMKWPDGYVAQKLHVGTLVSITGAQYGKVEGWILAQQRVYIEVNRSLPLFHKFPAEMSTRKPRSKSYRRIVSRSSVRRFGVNDGSIVEIMYVATF